MENFGEFDAHVKALTLPVVEPDGTLNEAELGSLSVTSPLAPGERLPVEKTAQQFGSVVGEYDILAQYVTTRDATFSVPRVVPSTRNRVEIDVVPVGTKLNVPERSRTLVRPLPSGLVLAGDQGKGGTSL